MINYIELTYREFMIAFYTPRIFNILNRSRTNTEAMKNAKSLEIACNSIFPHLERILQLSARDSEIHEETSEEFASLKQLKEQALLYQTIII